MLKRMYNKTAFRVLSCLLLGVILVQGPAMIFASPKAKAQIATSPSETTKNLEANVVDGHTVNDKSTSATNALLASDSGGSKYLETLASRGIHPDTVRYVDIGSLGTSNSDKDGLRLLAENLNTHIVPRCGGPRVVAVNAIIGGAEHPDGNLEGGLLFVATLETGQQKLVAAINADDAALNGNADPVIVPGDFFGNGAATGDTDSLFPGCPPIIQIIICWIRCIVIQQIIILVRCVVIQIIFCVRIGWSIVCFRARIVCCFILVIIRVIVICFINCIVITIASDLTKPGGLTDPRLAHLAGAKTIQYSDQERAVLAQLPTLRDLRGQFGLQPVG
jgi:hypothetical protein